MLKRFLMYATIAWAPLIFPPEVGAQQYTFKYYGVDQGLTNLGVRALFQDRRGFLWLSSEGGIFRYDGQRFQAYGQAEGLPPSNGAVFGEAPDGSLLVGGGFGLYRHHANRFERVAMPGAATVSWGAAIQSDGDGRTYIATEAGLMVMTEEPGTNRLPLALVRQPTHRGAPAAYGILVEKDTLWWGCGDELCVIRSDVGAVIGPSSGLPAAAWKGIRRAGNGDLWLQARTGAVAVMRKGRDRFEKPDLPPSRFGAKGLLSVDAEGRVIVPVGDGLVVQEGHGWKRVDRSSGLRGPVLAVLQDREGTLWLGLSGHGLVRWLGYGEWEYFNTDSGLPNDLVYEIALIPDGTVWAGTELGLLRGKRSGAGWNWRKQGELGDIPIHSVKRDRQGRLWLGTESHGAARLDPKTGAVEWFGTAQGLTAESPYTLMLDRENRVWAAALTGLFVADLKTLRFTRVGEVPATFCVAVVEAANGDIWAGSRTGLFRLRNGHWRRFTTADGLSHNEVLSLAADNNGDVWAGYQFGREIDKIHTGGNEVKITREAGGQDDSKGTTYFLEFDPRHRLWAGTNRGVDVRVGNIWRHYDQHDGLVWDDCDLNGFASDPDGSVWIGTSGGLSHFAPRDQTPWKDPPVAIFTKLTLGNINMDPAREVSVGHDANALATSFSALTFAREGAVIFRYRLAPLFAEWRETRQRDLQFPGLPPDSYRLEVQARDGWGRWSAEPAAFSFVVRPPWWRSWWFVSLLAVSVLSIAAIVVRSRNRALRQRQRDLMRLVDERTAELKQANFSLQLATSKLGEANRDLTRLSTLDGLTGIANRRMFDQTLEAEWGRVGRTGTHLSIVIMDVDFFKRLNDAAGHQAGDECLSLIATELAKVGRRPNDLVARIGGEEFALILPETDRFQAAELAESARLRVERLQIPHPDSPLGSSVTISLGVASAINGRFHSAAALVGAADHALYEAKRQGRNRTVSVSPAPDYPEALAATDLSRIAEAQPIARGRRASAR
ncbi:MAG: diguanylate cyclase [Bryobacteraceae bacterium]|jgi:diguanylate cyclase (GGDEF)-like protein